MLEVVLIFLPPRMQIDKTDLLPILFTQVDFAVLFYLLSNTFYRLRGANLRLEDIVNRDLTFLIHFHKFMQILSKTSIEFGFSINCMILSFTLYFYGEVAFTYKLTIKIFYYLFNYINGRIVI